MMYLPVAIALLALTSFVSAQDTTAAPTSHCSDTSTDQCAQSSKHLQEQVQSMQVVIDTLLVTARNDGIFESIRSFLKQIFGRDAFELFRHDWERNAKLSASMKDFLADHPVITETILESAKQIMSNSDDNTMFALYHSLSREASFTDVDAGFATLVVSVLQVLQGFSSSSYY